MLVTESGHLVFVRDGVLMAAPFSIAERRVTGPAVPLPDSVVTDGTGVAQLVSAGGTLAYVPAGPVAAAPTLGWVSRTGDFTALGPLPPGSRFTELSPDGKRALVFVDDLASGGGLGYVCLFDLARLILTRLNLGERVTDAPRWHPDGRRIAYGGPRLSVFDIDSGMDKPLTDAGLRSLPSSWSPDGKVLAYTFFSPQPDIYTLALEENARPQVFVSNAASDSNAAISPDGRWIAYVTGSEVWAARFPEGSNKTVISPGQAPVWNPNGRELFFVSQDALMAVPITPGQQLAIGTPRTLFRMRDPSAEEGFEVGTTRGVAYDVSPDGSRFLMMKTPAPPAYTEIVVVQNWFEELKRLAPAATGR